MLATRYGINPKKVTKWQKCISAKNLPMGLKNSASTVLTKNEEAMIIAFRKLTLLPLDDCLYTLQESIPHLTCSSLHWYFGRYNVNGRIDRLNAWIERLKTVNRFYYQTGDELQAHLKAFISACNFATRLKTLYSLAPYELIVKFWSKNPFVFIPDPSHLNPGLYI